MSATAHHPNARQIRGGADVLDVSPVIPVVVVEQDVHLVAVEGHPHLGGPRPEHGLDLADGQLAALRAVPRMVTRLAGTEQHLQHGADVGAVAGGERLDSVGDRGDEHAAEVEHDGAHGGTARSARRRSGHDSYPRCA